MAILPKSTNLTRIRLNLVHGNFDLDEADLVVLDRLTNKTSEATFLKHFSKRAVVDWKDPTVREYCPLGETGVQ